MWLARLTSEGEASILNLPLNILKRKKACSNYLRKRQHFQWHTSANQQSLMYVFNKSVLLKKLWQTLKVFLLSFFKNSK